MINWERFKKKIIIRKQNSLYILKITVVQPNLNCMISDYSTHMFQACFPLFRSPLCPSRFNFLRKRRCFAILGMFWTVIVLIWHARKALLPLSRHFCIGYSVTCLLYFHSVFVFFWIWLFAFFFYGSSFLYSLLKVNWVVSQAFHLGNRGKERHFCLLCAAICQIILI